MRSGCTCRLAHDPGRDDADSPRSAPRPGGGCATRSATRRPSARGRPPWRGRGCRPRSVDAHGHAHDGLGVDGVGLLRHRRGGTAMVSRRLADLADLGSREVDDLARQPGADGRRAGADGAERCEAIPGDVPGPVGRCPGPAPGPSAARTSSGARPKPGRRPRRAMEAHQAAAPREPRRGRLAGGCTVAGRWPAWRRTWSVPPAGRAFGRP